MDRPWFQLHTRDFLDCKELARCQPSERFVLLALMCLGHEGTPYGYLADDVGPLTEKYMAARCTVKASLLRDSITALLAAKRLGKTDEGILFVPRMVRDEQIRLARAKGGKQSQNNPNVPPKKDILPPEYKDGVEGYPSSGTKDILRGDPSGYPSVRSEGPPSLARAHAIADVRSDSDSDSDSSDSGNTENPSNGNLPHRDLSGFQKFRAAVEDAGVHWSGPDWDAAWHSWRVLDFAQKLAAVQGIRDRLGTGDFALYRTAPEKYLAKRMWERSIHQEQEHEAKPEYFEMPIYNPEDDLR